MRTGVSSRDAVSSRQTNAEPQQVNSEVSCTAMVGRQPTSAFVAFSLSWYRPRPSSSNSPVLGRWVIVPALIHKSNNPLIPRFSSRRLQLSLRGVIIREMGSGQMFFVGMTLKQRVPNAEGGSFNSQGASRFGGAPLGPRALAIIWRLRDPSQLRPYQSYTTTAALKAYVARTPM